jgi:hypothetical protein
MACEAVNITVDSTLFDSEDYYSLSDHDDYFTSDNLRTGKQGEQITVSALKTKYKTKDGFRVTHNQFGSQYEYSCGQGVDVKVYDGCKEIAELEVKNLAEQKKPYGTDFVRKKVLPRFSHSGGGLKLFVITFLSLLTHLAVQLLEQEGITIIEVGERLTSEFYRDLKKLYVLGNRIHKAITNFWHGKSKPKSRADFFAVVKPLSNYSPIPTPNTTPINSNNLTNITNIIEQHDTVHDNYSKMLEEIEVEGQKLKQEETERLRKLYAG